MKLRRPRRALRSLRAAGVVALVATAGLLPGVPSSALAGTDFEEADGNMVNDGGRDWVDFASIINCEAQFSGCAVDLPQGSGDDSMTGGAKDDSETVAISSGSVPNNKSDLSRAVFTSANIGNSQFVYLGWVRTNTLGTANFSIELNQVRNTSPLTPGSNYTFNRQAGDLLVLFDFASGGKANKVELGLSKWMTSGRPKEVCQAKSSLPCWGKVADLDANNHAGGSVNVGATVDKLYPEPDGGAVLPKLTFGEAAVNLTAAGVDTTCGFGQAMIRSRASSAFNAELKDFIIPAPVNVMPVVDVSRFSSKGAAMTARVFDSGLDLDPKTPGTQNEMLLGPTAASSQTGPGEDSRSDRLLGIDVPLQDESSPGPADPFAPKPLKEGEVLHVDVLGAAAKSTVTRDSGITTQNSSAIATGVNILNGTVTADVVQATASTHAGASGAGASAIFSGLKNLKVDPDGPGGADPIAMDNVAPNTRIGLSEAVFGPGSYVELRREVRKTTYPAPGTPLRSRVTYQADVEEITMIHVHVTDRTPDSLLGGSDDVTTDIVIASADAQSKADAILCNAVQEVEGNATILRGNVGNLASASIGSVAIPSAGGASHQELHGFSIANLVSGGTSVSHSDGGWDALASTANSTTSIAGLCIDLEGDGTCEISADAVKSKVTSTATATARGSEGTASFVNLRVLGQVVAPDPGLVHDIGGIAKVAFNERTCDVGVPSGDGSTCTTSTGARTAMTVRALRIVVSGLLPEPNPLNLSLGSELVLGEVHSGATFVAI